MNYDKLGEQMENLKRLDETISMRMSAVRHAIPRNGPAEDLCTSILNRILEFERALDDNHETFIALATFGREITMAVESVGYKEPNIIIFSGDVGGSRAVLMQHINQLSFLLLSVEKAIPGRPARRIGFATD